MIFLLVFIVMVWYLIKTYNQIKPLDNVIAEYGSNIKVVIEKRNTIVASLNNVVNSYSDYEKNLFEKISEDMKPTVSTNILISRLSGLYPELKANDNYRALVDGLYSVESERQSMIELYNNKVKLFNNTVTSFPEIVFCSLLSFREKPYYT